MNPKDLKLYTFIDGDFSMDINVSKEKNNIYMNQTEIATLLGIGQSTVSKIIKKMGTSKWDIYSKNEQIGIILNGKEVDYYGLEIIKEIGQKYNPKRIRKLEEWLEQIVIENSQEVIDDNFEIVRYNQGKVPIMALVDYINKTACLPQDSIALLFGVSIPTISEHITNILKEGELEEWATIRNFRKVQINKKHKLLNRELLPRRCF